MSDAVNSIERDAPITIARKVLGEVALPSGDRKVVFSKVTRQWFSGRTFARFEMLMVKRGEPLTRIDLPTWALDELAVAIDRFEDGGDDD